MNFQMQVAKEAAAALTGKYGTSYKVGSTALILCKFFNVSLWLLCVSKNCCITCISKYCFAEFLLWIIFKGLVWCNMPAAVIWIQDNSVSYTADCRNEQSIDQKLLPTWILHRSITGDRRRLVIDHPDPAEVSSKSPICLHWNQAKIKIPTRSTVTPSDIITQQLLAILCEVYRFQPCS